MYKFTDTEIKKLLKENLVILVDTREQKNQHILNYFDSKKLNYKVKKVDEGDYTAIIKARADMGIYRDLYFPVCVERKNSINELVGSIKDATRFEHEFTKAKLKGTKVFLVVEETNGLENIRAGKYRSLYEPAAFIGKLTSLEDKFINGTIFCSKEDSGFNIYRKLYYSVRNFLKNGELELGTPEELEA